MNAPIRLVRDAGECAIVLIRYRRASKGLASSKHLQKCYFGSTETHHSMCHTGLPCIRSIIEVLSVLTSTESTHSNDGHNHSSVDIFHQIIDHKFKQTEKHENTKIQKIEKSKNRKIENHS